MNNIAFILLDQVRVDMLGTYGHKIVKTPNMDAIAADGVKFNNALHQLQCVVQQEHLFLQDRCQVIMN